ncbi:MAG: hemerythrin domain-containing protein [Gallionella sp.]
MTSIDVIYQQHRNLIDKLNELNGAIAAAEPRENIYTIIEEIIAYTRFHFSTEERFMIETGFEDIEWHKEKHRQLIQDAISLKEKLNHIGEEMFTDWFVHWPFGRVLAHIQYADRQFENHINQHAQAK